MSFMPVYNYVSLIVDFDDRCLLFSNWCYWWLSHVIYQFIIMHFTPFKMCILL